MKIANSPKIHLILAGFVALSLATTATAATWSVDKAHTEVNFSVKHFFTPVNGSFGKWDIDLQYDAENPEKKSTKVEKVGDNKLVAHGVLSIKGHEQEIELAIAHLGTKQIPAEMQPMLRGSKQVASFEATTSIDRGDYEVGVGNWAATVVVGDKVDITILLEAHQR
jgi:polyisoprenoid-binding protein YceI